MEKKKSFINIRVSGLITITLCLLSLFTTHATLAKQQPKLNLFPIDVTEHLRNTGVVAKDMENRLKGAIGKLENQTKLYNETGCKGSEDPGCIEIAKQMGDHYMEMITIMKNSLPEMKSSIRSTNKGIGANLRKELGKKTTPADIQRLLSQKNKPKVFKGKYSLSSRFAKYHELISSGRTNNLATLASEIYLDSKEVLNMIDLMEAEISQQETYIRLGRMYGTLTSEMMETVQAVKSVVFGEAEDDSALPFMEDENSGGFHSPLEMD
ncbi:MAG: hypothetical protein V6Z89_20765 [Desulfobacter sp.]